MYEITRSIYTYKIPFRYPLNDSKAEISILQIHNWRSLSFKHSNKRKNHGKIAEIEVTDRLSFKQTKFKKKNGMIITPVD